MSNVVIVEDEAILALDLIEMCEALGCRVLGVAASAPQAKERFAGVCPEILITDMDLADRSTGVQVVEMLRRRCPDIRVIFVTATTCPNKLELIRRAEPECVLSKPLNFSQLDAALRSVAAA
ncbi:Response regulator receiver domain-containing protein [Roseivivax marinus]|uniref:response regulator n=1 Tax=Roseivivax marinus TaxID=1379903 RepID=UPI0008D7565E|nr:response regulator [Roseivivax marinus]SEL62121.1 Response regulator receiver domain-containing protein [Roseivivax marinus]